MPGLQAGAVALLDRRVAQCIVKLDVTRISVLMSGDERRAGWNARDDGGHWPPTLWLTTRSKK